MTGCTMAIATSTSKVPAAFRTRETRKASNSGKDQSLIRRAGIKGPLDVEKAREKKKAKRAEKQDQRGRAAFHQIVTKVADSI